jgi:uncharacterized protein YfeS
MDNVEIRVDIDGSHPNSQEQRTLASSPIQEGLARLAAKIQANALAQLSRFDKKARLLELSVKFSTYRNAKFDLVPNLNTISARKALELEMVLDGRGVEWLEDSEILHRVEIAAVTGITMLVRGSKGDDSELLAWLRSLDGIVAVRNADVPRCPYCHTRVRNERTRLCRRCGNSWHEAAPDGSLPPAQARRKLLQPAPPPDGLAALARFPAGAFRYPYNLKKGAHPRARKLMPHAPLWDVVNENAPFGSDEGNAALDEFAAWRAVHPGAPLLGFLEWTMDSPSSSDWKMPLGANETSDAVLADWIARAKAGTFDFHNEVWRRDTNIIASALAQLVFEGTIDADAKPFVMLAVARQSHPAVLAYNSNTRSRTLMMERIRAVIEAA